MRRVWKVRQLRVQAGPRAATVYGPPHARRGPNDNLIRVARRDRQVQQAVANQGCIPVSRQIGPGRAAVLGTICEPCKRIQFRAGRRLAPGLCGCFRQLRCRDCVDGGRNRPRRFGPILKIRGGENPAGRRSSEELRTGRGIPDAIYRTSRNPGQREIDRSVAHPPPIEFRALTERRHGEQSGSAQTCYRHAAHGRKPLCGPKTHPTSPLYSQTLRHPGLSTLKQSLLWAGGSRMPILLCNFRC